MTEKSQAIASFLEELFPDSTTALCFKSPYEALVAIMLSAQTTDKAVNRVTPSLFHDYPNASFLAKATPKEVEKHIQTLGLFHNKAKNLVAMASQVVELHDGEIPLVYEDLVKLPGVGNKTANVFLAETCGRPAFAVDTHVSRIYKRLGYAKSSDEPGQIQKKLEKAFPKEIWIDMHHRSIDFGRAICSAQNPKCSQCKLTSYCSFFKKRSSTTGR